MIGPKEWEELKNEISKLNPILRIKRLKGALVRVADSKLKREINELILKVEADSIEFFDSRSTKPLSADSLEKLVSGRNFEEGRNNRKIEDIAMEESSLTDSEVKKQAVNYDPNKKNEFYDSNNVSLNDAYKPTEHNAHKVDFEENSLNKRKDYVNGEEIDFNGTQS
jgi:hypothetical protein